jgi:hypothetical protein
MPVTIAAVEHGRPGHETFVSAVAEDGRAAVVFEDNGETATFYALETAQGPVLDAIHIYNVTDVVDRDRPSEYKLGWSPTERQAILLINGSAHAVFDFDHRKGWCWTGFPPDDTRWSLDGHQWDEACLDHFR